MFELWEEDDTSAHDLIEKYWHWPDDFRFVRPTCLYFSSWIQWANPL